MTSNTNYEQKDEVKAGEVKENCVIDSEEIEVITPELYEQSIIRNKEK